MYSQVAARERVSGVMPLSLSFVMYWPLFVKHPVPRIHTCFPLKIAIHGKTYKKGGGAKLQVISQKLQVNLL